MFPGMVIPYAYDPNRHELVVTFPGHEDRTVHEPLLPGETPQAAMQRIVSTYHAEFKETAMEREKPYGLDRDATEAPEARVRVPFQSEKQAREVAYRRSTEPAGALRQSTAPSQQERIEQLEAVAESYRGQIENLLALIHEQATLLKAVIERTGVQP
jgi:hypothetical protein